MKSIITDVRKIDGMVQDTSRDCQCYVSIDEGDWNTLKKEGTNATAYVCGGFAGAEDMRASILEDFASFGKPIRGAYLLIRSKFLLMRDLQSIQSGLDGYQDTFRIMFGLSFADAPDGEYGYTLFIVS